MILFHRPEIDTPKGTFQLKVGTGKKKKEAG